MDTCSGVVTLGVGGQATVDLPWRDGHELELSYQLTCMGGFAPVFVVEDAGRHSFQIMGGRQGLAVSWTVRARRVSTPLEQTLPPRVRQTLEALITGASDKEIATRLGISPNTVHQYVKSLLRTYGAESRLQLVSMMLARCACGTDRA